MQLRLLKFLLWLLSIPPLRINHGLGGCIGWLSWYLPTRARRISMSNLALCFPELDDAERRQLSRRSLIETGKAVTETGWLWCRPRSQVEALTTEVIGSEHLQAAKRNSAGVIIISPHLGSWEYCVIPLIAEGNPIFMFRPPRKAALEPLLRQSRVRFGGELASADPAGIKQLMKGLRATRTVGILPDQEPPLANGVFAPFFGVPANTMTLLARLAKRSGAGLVMMFSERLPAGRGYRIHYLPAEPAIADSDMAVATAALNRSLELCIRKCPEQYIWSYKRFRWLPDGTRRPYG